jgi:hypothetical protein
MTESVRVECKFGCVVHGGWSVKKSCEALRLNSSRCG